MATSELNPNEMGISHAPEAARSFGEFVDTIAALRRPDGCPWDREQTHASIASNMLEEAYEAVDTIAAISALSSEASIFYFEKYNFTVYDKTIYDQLESNYADYLIQAKSK